MFKPGFPISTLADKPSVAHDLSSPIFVSFTLGLRNDQPLTAFGKPSLRGKFPPGCVGHNEELELHLVGYRPASGEPRPIQGILALLDSLLQRSTPVVKVQLHLWPWRGGWAQ